MRWLRRRARPAETPRYLIVGLGNPGPEYAGTRHNVGFRVVERLAERHGLRFKKWDPRAQVAAGEIAGTQVCLVKPQTYMNRSGNAVAALLNAFSLGPEAVLIVADDIDLPPGRLRLRQRGSAGGHRGIASILQAARTQEVARLRLGVGRPPPEEAVDYVLSKVSSADRPAVEEAVARAAEALETVLTDGFETAMNRYNPAPKPPRAPDSSANSSATVRERPAPDSSATVRERPALGEEGETERGSDGETE